MLLKYFLYKFITLKKYGIIQNNKINGKYH